MDPLALRLERFGVAFGSRVILAHVDLAVPARGTTTLMGPVGVGKSTLLRTLAGRNDAEPSLRTWGAATYLGAPWRSGPLPALVGQQARLLAGTALDALLDALPDRAQRTRAEQRARVLDHLASLGLDELAPRLDEPTASLSRGDVRRVALAAVLSTDPPLLLVDEPTAGLHPDEQRDLLALLARRADTHAVLLVTHRRTDALALPGRVALLAGGAVVEEGSTDDVFARPRSPILRAFVETGSCAVGSPPTLDELVADGLAPGDLLAPPTTTANAPPLAPLPSIALSIRWVDGRALAGVRRPGLLGSLDDDLGALASAGVRVLVCPEDAQVLTPDVLARYGIDSLALPIVDMDAPSCADAAALCELVQAAIDAGRPVAVHCRAGLGRTGTMLAALLVWRGASAEAALARVRTVEPRFVQSEAQLRFLAAFEDFLRGPRHDGAAPPVTRC